MSVPPAPSEAATASLNPRQHEAVHAPAGPLLILAGAGSGKTRVITHRIAHLIDQDGTSPASILALTFTNRAAREMRERAARLCGPRAQQATITTFHSACARWLRREGHRIGLSANYSIHDTDDQLVVLKPLCQQLGLPHDATSLRDWRQRIEGARNEALTPHALHSRAVRRDSEELALLYEHYCAALTRANALDFGGLIASMVHLLRTDSALQRAFTERYRHLLVDEFQDTNPAQYALLEALAPDPAASLMVVGDDDQAIYGWRGASVANMHRFREERQPQVIALEQNYRSTPQILDAAHRIVASVPDRMPKRLFSEGAPGPLPELFVGGDDREEADFVARRVLALIRDEGLRPADIAVFYRTNAQSRVLEEALRRVAVAHEVVGGVGFFERREIRDISAYLRLAANPRDDAAFRRVVNLPPRGIGPGTLLLLDEVVSSGGAGSLREAVPQLLDRPLRRMTRRTRAGLQALDTLLSQLERLARTARVEELIALILVDSGYRTWLVEREPEEAEDRLRNISELQNAAADFREELPESNDPPMSPVVSFLEQVQLRAASDAVDPDLGAVHLMTVHTAKGLEFPAVFVTGLEQDLFPLIRGPEPDLAEERRLAYVALTRAERFLHLSCARQRRLFAQPKRTEPSEFLRELEAEHVRWAPESAVTSLQWHAGGEGTPDATYRPQRNAVDEFDQRPWEERMAQVEPEVPDSGMIFDDSHYPEARAASASKLVGRRARHKLFGTGEVLQADPTGDRIRLLIDFPERGRKNVILDYVELL